MEETKTIESIEEELTELLSNDRNSWINIYNLMDEVKKNKLYEGKYASFTAWVNCLADTCKVHVSLLWSRMKAGNSYAAYEERAKAKGKSVPALNSIQVSPDNFNLIERIAGSNDKVADELMDKVIAGELKRQDLKDAWRTVKANKNTRIRVNSHDKSNDDINHSDEIATAADIVFELKKGDWLVPKSLLSEDVSFEETKWHLFLGCKFKVFTEFAVRTGTSRHARRIDALAVENCSVSWQDAKDDNLVLHGFEIKVTKSDLLADHKMLEYTDFCDRFWIAIPESLIDDAKSISLPEWGIVALMTSDDDTGIKKHLKVIREPQCKTGVMRDKTFSSIVYQLL